MSEFYLSNSNKRHTNRLTFSGLLFAPILSTLILISAPAEAKVKAISRANCVGLINESITYDRPELHPFLGAATGSHKPWGEVFDHIVSDPDNFNAFKKKWRYYAGDVGDAASVTVTGIHSWTAWDDLTGEIVDSGTDTTFATDCNLTEW